jgi:hypothetical protein
MSVVAPMHTVTVRNTDYPHRRDIGHLLDTAAARRAKYLTLLARPRGFEPLLPP